MATKTTKKRTKRTAVKSGKTRRKAPKRKPVTIVATMTGDAERLHLLETIDSRKHRVPTHVLRALASVLVLVSRPPLPFDPEEIGLDPLACDSHRE